MRNFIKTGTELIAFKLAVAMAYLFLFYVKSFTNNNFLYIFHRA